MKFKNEILDEQFNVRKLNKKGINKFFTLLIGSILFFLFMILIENYLNPGSWKTKNMPSLISIITTFLLLLIISIQAPKYLNEFDDRMSKFKVVIYSALNLFLVTLLFSLFQKLMIYDKSISEIPIPIITEALMIILLGIPISNIRIQALRKSKLIWPIIIFLTSLGITIFYL